MLWGRSVIALAGNLTARVSILRFSLNGLVLVAGMRVSVLAWWLKMSLKRQYLFGISRFFC